MKCEFRKPQNSSQYPDTIRGLNAMSNDLTSSEAPGIAAERSAYVRSAEAKLAEKRTALELVKLKVNRAVAAGRIARSDQLINAERQATGCLLAVENWIECLSAEPGDDWQESRLSTDIALEELSKSVKQMVARFT